MPSQYIPHGHCYLWQTNLVGLHVISDALIAIAYFSIPLLLLYFVRKRTDIPFPAIFFLFSLFIITCGTTHLMAVWTLWHPAYWLSGAIKAVTALISVFTAFTLFSILPQALDLPSADDLRQVNQQLEAQIEERKQAEANLRASEERWQLAIRGSNDGIWDRNIATDELFLSPRFKQMLGYEDDELTNCRETWIQRIHPDERDYVLAINQLHIDQETPFYTAEYRLLCKDGSYRWFSDRAKALCDRSGNAIRMTGAIRDITARKRAESELLLLNQELEARIEERTAAVINSERRFRSLFESAPDFVYVLDCQGIIQQVNSNVVARSGYTETELIGQPITAFLAAQTQASCQQLVSNLYALVGHQRTHQQEMMFVCKEGQFLIMDCAWTLIEDQLADGYILLQQRDITARNAVDRMKNEFISVVSHELRTPLTSVHGALDLLYCGLVDPSSKKGQHVFSIAVENSNRLVKLVNDILELERLESGKIRLVKACVSTKDIIQETYSAMELMAERADVSLETVENDLLLWVDRDRIIQVLTNLLDNAIKFSDPCSAVQITTELAASDASTDADVVKFAIKDSGRGIPANKIHDIFGRFHQVDASDSRRKGGTGLGLAICQSIVRQHGGDIWVDSTLDVGSCFYFTVPRYCA